MIQLRTKERITVVLNEHYGDPLLRAQLKHRIAVVEYEYDVELLEREFRRMQPTEYHVSAVSNLSLDMPLACLSRSTSPRNCSIGSTHICSPNKNRSNGDNVSFAINP